MTIAWELVVDDGLAGLAVEARVFRGRCADTGVLVFQTSVGPDASAPPILARGDYAFEAVALDGDCMLAGRGCTDLTLPGFESRPGRDVSEIFCLELGLFQ